MMTIPLLAETEVGACLEGPGALRGTLGAQAVSFPLAALAVQARLSGPLASVDVRQQFSNPYQDVIEAQYIFPLPAGASVYRFRLQVKDRMVDGLVQERSQARATYQAGLKAGHRSALMEQERDNVFTVSLGNLPPGETVTIELSYAHRVEVHEAEHMFRFPLVLAERYMPGSELPRTPVGHGTAADTSRVADASRLTPPRLCAGLHTGANLDLRVTLETGGLLPLRLGCSQHVVQQTAAGSDLVVELAREGELLNRDFVLKYRLADSSARGLLLASAEHFMLQVLPPAEAPSTSMPRDLVIILDRSGSMKGVKMDSARQATERLLDALKPDDGFTIMAFDTSVEMYDGTLGTPESHRVSARQWLSQIGARGGTEIREALNRAIDRTEKAERLGCMVIITDGQVGNEPEIYRMVQQRSPRARMFTLGIDTAVNDAFLRRLAGIGRGTCELVTPGEALSASVSRLAREIGTPVVTDLVLKDEGFGVVMDSLAPARMPDVFAARPAFIMGRHQGSGSLRVEGRPSYAETLTPATTTNAALGVLWAREQVTALEDRMRIETVDRTAVEKQILELALKYQLLTRFTAFVLVDKAEVVSDGSQPRTVVQPVETPAQWAAPVAAPVAMPASRAFSGPPMMAASPVPLMARKQMSSDELAGSPPPGGSPLKPGLQPSERKGSPAKGLLSRLFGGGGGATPGGFDDMAAAPRPSPAPNPTLLQAVEAFSKLWQEAHAATTLYTPEVKKGMEDLLKALALIGSDQAIRLMEAGAVLNTALKLDRVEVASMGAWLDEVRRLVNLPPLTWWSDNI